MKKVHYFQRFSKKEDVVTNNTLLLFERLQHENARLFEQILRELIKVSPEELTVGAELTQQEAAKSGRIADGVIHQRSFHIVLETKLHANFNVLQLQGHLASFDSSVEGLQVLLLLGTEEPINFPAAQKVAADYNEEHKKSVQLAWTTFADVVKTCEREVPDHEFMMLEILEDYEQFCKEEGLIPNNDAELLVVNCARSLEDNIKFRLYYHPSKPHPQPKFIGFYADKAVQAIGLLEKVIMVDRTEDRRLIVKSDNLTLTQEEETGIARSMDNASERGWDITSGHYFFLASRVERTLFQKKTKFPFRGVWRYFDLREELGLDAKKELPELSSLAQELGNKTW